jgi:hypothetical protein
MMPSGIWVLSGVVNQSFGKSQVDRAGQLAREKQCRESLSLRVEKGPAVRLWAPLKGLVKALRTVYRSMVE